MVCTFVLFWLGMLCLFGAYGAYQRGHETLKGALAFAGSVAVGVSLGFLLWELFT